MNRIRSFQPASRQGRFLLIGAGLLVIVLGLLAFIQLTPPNVTVTYFEVGQADSILIQTSEGKNMLIDAGYPDSRAADKLRERNITHLDLVVLTHPHDDHVGGLTEVLNTIAVDRVVDNGHQIDTPAYKDYQHAVEDSSAEYKVVRSGDKLSLGRLTFDVLSPRKINPTTINNNSVVLRLVVGKVSFLFTGDTQRLEEERLMAAGKKVSATIFKVPHHASETSTSSEFLVAVDPEVAIYFAEVGNIHGFPHQVTLDNLAAVGAKVYGTDVNGTITVTTDGKTYTVTTEREGVPVAPPWSE
jgi:beta-lactamase superfamily II metal-dependent hydrolase